MGNTPSSERAASAGPPPMETEQHGIGRMAAITGAKTAQETRTKPRGPKASGADLPFIQVCFWGRCILLALLATVAPAWSAASN